MHKEPVSYLLKKVPHITGRGALDKVWNFSSGYSKVFVLTDENTEKNCLPLLLGRIPHPGSVGILRILSGESNKNIETVVSVWDQLTRMEADRKALLINLGGGVITDLGGFAAATYKRGIDFINIPTTLLGQVDAAIGSKTGVDFQKYKNHVGLFADPKAVIIDPLFLDTLPEKHLRSGMAEVIKYALIMDKPLWERLKGKSYSALLQDVSAITKMSVKDKITVVRKDKHESGLRKILNFGHTAGHALETFLMSSDSPATHGEAVAAGMICAARISTKQTGLPAEDAREIYHTIDGIFERLCFTESDIPVLLHLMRQDKKNQKGELRFTLLKKTGEAVPDIAVSEETVREVLQSYLNNQ
ncbi:3-dehydroquinate synthase [Candidatus Sulfidibacterium hydrothermale]|uniref:3-dehydroquinate synthase n=1 Tax=Candidatus Sulfidibacterium hydrothermale TaxID=2875962 RepID=UPI001F0A5861|nr:3-dehydroquinate synthase [Candidatus Sulfidibacterium hydrothermale]UBM61116.1 3-dehydroquinate synthase [Candidatus Sulfidibacterium hydrothermale]